MRYSPSEGSSLDECREAYDLHYRSGGVSYRRREQQSIVSGFVTAAGWSPGMSILDVGCGIGFHSKILSRKGFRVTGIDFSEKAIAMTASRGGPSYILQDATTYSPKQKFDGILFNDFSLFHYELNGINQLGVDMDAFIWRIFSWLAPGGSMLIKAPTNIPGIDANSVVDFTSALHPHAGPLTQSNGKHSILITARSRDDVPKPVATPQVVAVPAVAIEGASPDPDHSPEPTPEPEKDRLTVEDVTSDPMGYPDTWGYGHKS